MHKKSSGSVSTIATIAKAVIGSTKVSMALIGAGIDRGEIDKTPSIEVVLESMARNIDKLQPFTESEAP